MIGDPREINSFYNSFYRNTFFDFHFCFCFRCIISIGCVLKIALHWLCPHTLHTLLVRYIVDVSSTFRPQIHKCAMCSCSCNGYCGDLLNHKIADCLEKRRKFSKCRSQIILLLMLNHNLFSTFMVETQTCSINFYEFYQCFFL